MTPQPPSSPEGSPLSPRHRPSLGNLAQDTTELDLWAFEDDLDHPSEQKPPETEEVIRISNREIPAPRERQAGKPQGSEDRPASKPPAAEEQIRMNVNKVRTKSRPEGPVPGQSKPESDFDDLEHWEDVKVEPDIEELPETAEPEAPAESSQEEPAPVAEVPAEPAAPEPPLQPVSEDDEFSPHPGANAIPVSLRPHLSLSKVERIGLIALLVLLLGGGAAVFLVSLKRLPTESTKAEANDFPIKGSRVTIHSAKSYWRAPITDGMHPDTFRRGTVLLPVLEISVSGGPAAVRVLFRNDDQTVQGDAVTRSIHGEARLTIPATAGFDDTGMHAAYRTGESKPWTIEVLEAPSADSPGKDFKRIFEMNISADRR